MHQEICQKIKYNFKNPLLLEEALTHSSMSQINKSIKNYERLEFLGDSVLSLVITEILIKEFPSETEGDLARRRAVLISGLSLCDIANKLNLSQYIRVSAGEENIGGRESPQILEDVLESLIGAIYMDGGLKPCVEFITEHWYSIIKNEKTPPIDAKTYLQEWTQEKELGLPKYKVIERTGPAHSPVFLVEVLVKTMPIFKASAASKRTAEKQAAQAMIDYIKENNAKD